MRLDGKSVLVTGAAGFIGSHLADAALSRGASRVVGIDNFTGGRERHLEHLDGEERFSLVRGDVRDFEVVEPLVREADVVFHDAASKLVVSLENPRIDLLTNTLGTFNVLMAAKDRPGCRIVHASTGSVLGSSELPMSEDHEKNPSTTYGISKLAAENYCVFFAREHGVRVSVLRYFHVFGPRQDHDSEAGVISIFLGRILSGQPPVVFGSGEQVRCFTFVEDVVRANFLMFEKPETVGEIYNVASRTRISIRELAELLIERYGDTALAPEFGPARRGENLRPIPETGKIEGLGFAESVDFHRGLDRTRDWVRGELERRRV